MKKPATGIALMLALLFPFQVFSQKKGPDMKFGKISDEEVAMKSCPLDADAGAVVLFDKGFCVNSFVGSSFWQTYNRRTRIKIFKRSAYDLANYAFLLFKGDDFTKLNVSSFNLDNDQWTETKLDKSQVLDEKLTKGIILRRFVVPGVREETIIDIEYTIEKPGARYIPDWEFQAVDFPTLWSEYSVDAPSFFEFKKLATGWEPFTVATDEESKLSGEKGGHFLHYIVENAPALKVEPFVASSKEYLTQIRFDISAIRHPSGYFERLNTSWPNLADQFFEDGLEDLMDEKKSTADEAEKLTAGKALVIDKVAAVYAHIGKGFQANNLQYAFSTQTFKSLLDTHKGSVTDLNLLCVNLLRRAKVNAWPVLIRRRGEGRIIEWSVSQFAFDRIITAFEDDEKQIVLLDAAAWPNPVGILPLEDLNGKGFLIKEKQWADWVPLVNKTSNRDAIVADLALSEEGALKGSVTFSESGFPATAFREAVKKTSEKGATAEKFRPLAADGSLVDLKLENADKPEEPNLKGTFSIETKAGVTASAGKIYIQPSLGLGDREQPLKAKERKFNIDLGAPEEVALSLTYTIPPGWKVEEMPKPARLALGDKAITFDFLTEQAGDKIKFNIRKKVRSTYFEAAQSEDFKQFFTAVLAKLGEQVVLSKA